MHRHQCKKSRALLSGIPPFIRTQENIPFARILPVDPSLSVPFFSMLLLTSRSGSSVAAISGSSHIQCCCRANILVVFICCCCCCYPSRDYYYCGACVAKEWRAHTTAEILFAFKFTSVPFFPPAKKSASKRWQRDGFWNRLHLIMSRTRLAFCAKLHALP